MFLIYLSRIHQYKRKILAQVKNQQQQKLKPKLKTIMRLKLATSVTTIILLTFLQSCTTPNPYEPVTPPSTSTTPGSNNNNNDDDDDDDNNGNTTTLTVTVPANIAVTKGGTVATTNFVSTPIGATFAWTNSNTAIGLAASGSGNVPSFTATNAGTTAIIATITVIPTLNGTAGTPSSYTITVNPTAPSPGTPTVAIPANITVNNNGTVAATSFVSTPAGGTFAWTNSNTAIGLVASGSGNIPSFTAINTGTTAIIATITVTPTVNGVKGTPSSYTITVNPTQTTPTAITLTGSSSGSTASHNAGQNCMSCHTPGTSAGNKGVWVIGGTAYTSSAGTTIANNVVVKFYTGPNGTGTLKYILNGNAKGNFYTANTVDFTGGLYPAVTGATTTKYMSSPITNGACNSCHTGGTGTARVWAN